MRSVRLVTQICQRLTGLVCLVVQNLAVNVLLSTEFIEDNVESISTGKHLIRQIRSGSVGILGIDHEEKLVTFASDQDNERVDCRVVKMTVIPRMSQILVMVRAPSSGLHIAKTRPYLREGGWLWLHEMYTNWCRTVLSHFLWGIGETVRSCYPRTCSLRNSVY